LRLFISIRSNLLQNGTLNSELIRVRRGNMMRPKLNWGELVARKITVIFNQHLKHIRQRDQPCVGDFFKTIGVRYHSE